ncbi:MAG: transposase [Clostridium sp.]|uniref:transposase n=1 Tax=Clostridium sp. TaxID=1506 RepID=UPI003F396F5A
MKSYKYCPYCKRTILCKNGKFNNIQRYKCLNKDCNKTFSDSTNSEFYYSKKYRHLKEDYINLMNAGLSLNLCALALNISLKTSFIWRHKILHSMHIKTTNHKLNNYVELINSLFKENFKGSKNITSNKRRRVFITSAIDTNLKYFSIISAYDFCNHTILSNALLNKFQKSSILFGHKNRYLTAFARTFNENISYHSSSKKSVDTTLDEHRFLSDEPGYIPFLYYWFIRFRGVATKYLERYFAWFNFEFKNYISP